MNLERSEALDTSTTSYQFLTNYEPFYRDFYPHLTQNSAMSYPELKGRTYIVTGAGSGMGQQIAILLAQQGANVGLIDIREPEDTKDEILKADGKALSIACDVTVADQVNKAVQQVKTHFGGLDGEICSMISCDRSKLTQTGAANMAGISETKRTKMGGFAMKTLDDEDWNDIMSVNLDGVKNCLRAEIAAIEGNGSIVSASSVGGQYG
jgi:NAD(P)-dependent dehydrogenase (short-subunit alcohol dehydrogenase family)